MKRKAFLSGLGIGTIVALVATAWKQKGGLFVGNNASANQVRNNLEEWWDGEQERFTTTMADFGMRLSSLQEVHGRSAISIDEGQRSVAVELRRIRTLVTWSLILSCFGVVSFTIVLFLAYIKF